MKKVDHNEPKRKSQNRIWSFSFSILLLVCYYVYFLLRIDPRLIYQSQEPVFFFDRYFIGEFLRYPGGINELIAGFLSQFFYHSWMRAALLVLVFACVTWNTKLLTRSLRNGRWVVFSSKRQDGICTHFYFSYFDAEGRFSKPFLLPQKDLEYHQTRVVVYNIPEFVNGPVKIRPQALIKTAWSQKIIKARLDPKVDIKSDRQTEKTPYKPTLHN